MDILNTIKPLQTCNSNGPAVGIAGIILMCVGVVSVSDVDATLCIFWLAHKELLKKINEVISN